MEHRLSCGTAAYGTAAAATSASGGGGGPISKNSDRTANPDDVSAGLATTAKIARSMAEAGGWRVIKVRGLRTVMHELVRDVGGAKVN